MVIRPAFLRQFAVQKIDRLAHRPHVHDHVDAFDVGSRQRQANARKSLDERSKLAGRRKFRIGQRRHGPIESVRDVDEKQRSQCERRQQRERTKHRQRLVVVPRREDADANGSDRSSGQHGPGQFHERGQRKSRAGDQRARESRPAEHSPNRVRSRDKTERPAHVERYQMAVREHRRRKREQRERDQTALPAVQRRRPMPDQKAEQYRNENDHAARGDEQLLVLVTVSVRKVVAQTPKRRPLVRRECGRREQHRQRGDHARERRINRIQRQVARVQSVKPDG
jgi:hypothetical protein